MFPRLSFSLSAISATKTLQRRSRKLQLPNRTSPTIKCKSGQVSTVLLRLLRSWNDAVGSLAGAYVISSLLSFLLICVFFIPCPTYNQTTIFQLLKLLLWHHFFFSRYDSKCLQIENIPLRSLHQTPVVMYFMVIVEISFWK